MKTIKVSNEMYNSLMELSKDITTQDNRCTAMPYFFQIQTKEIINVPEDSGTECWYYDGSKIETEEEINSVIYDCHEGLTAKKVIKEMSDCDKEEILESAGWQKAHYDYEYKYQNAFFTEKACKLHIEQNKHHYNNPIDYLSFAFRNIEMEMVMKFLCELTGGKLHK